MRPAGEVAQALLQAARDLVTPERGATLAELAARACVGKDVARYMVPKLKSRGHLQIVRDRRSAGRNRPMAEYVPAAQVTEAAGWVDLGRCLSGWAK